MNLKGHLHHTGELLKIYRTGHDPADRVIARIFREKKYLGSKDRQFIGDTFFHTIRNLIRIDESIRTSLENAPFIEWITRSIGFPITDPVSLKCWQTDVPEPRTPGLCDEWFDLLRVTLAANDINREIIPEFHDHLLEKWPIQSSWTQGEWVSRMISRSSANMRNYKKGGLKVAPELQFSIPPFFFGLLGYGMKASELKEFYASLQEPAPVVLRINPLKTTVEEYQELLKVEGFLFQKADLLPHALVGSERIPNGRLPKEEEGFAEYQDIGSQLLVESLPVKPGMTVIDACAGGGGKSLQFATRMNNQGEVWAYDVNAKRLRNTFIRAEKAGLSIIKPVMDNVDVGSLPSYPDLTKFQDKADIVFADTPCTGSGTIRRSPDLRYRITNDDLREKMDIQEKILNHWKQTVKPGGLLVFATCSFFREEGEDIVDTFIKKNPEFAIIPLEKTDVADKTLVTRQGYLRTYPNRHMADGFFMAILKRKA